MDALLLTRKAQSLADLSLSCVFRRQWPSVYEALQDTRPSREQLMKLSGGVTRWLRARLNLTYSSHPLLVKVALSRG